MVACQFWPEKCCRHCDTTKPLVHGFFYQRSDGTWDSWCCDCKREYNRQERTRRKEAEYKLRAGLRLTAQDENAIKALENQRRAQRRYQKRRWQNPEYRRASVERRREYDERNRETKRENARMYYREHEAGGSRTAKPTKERKYYIENLSPTEMLGVETFAHWIETTFPGIPKYDLSWRLGMSIREVEHILDRVPTAVRLTTVDRAFCRIGRPDLLESLYPLEVAG